MAASDALMPGMGSVLGGAAALGGLAYTLSKGESQMPSQMQTVQSTYAPQQYATGQSLVTQGQGEVAQGTADLSQAVAGKLTPAERARLNIMRTNEANQAYQMYEGMGRTPGKDTSFLSTQQELDEHILAMQQSFIDTNIKLAFAEIGAGQNFITAGGTFEQAAAGELENAAKMQYQLDKDYSDAISGAFKNVAMAFSSGMGGGTGKGTPIGG